MESPAADAEIILSDALLNFVLDQCVLSPLPWIRFDRHALDRTSLLRSLAVLGGVSKELRLRTRSTVQLAALRLASFDVELASPKVQGATKAESVLEIFDMNYNIFSNSWRVEVDIPINLRSVALDKLQAAELHELRQILHGGWHLKTYVCKGDGQADAPNVWVTPTSRILDEGSRNTEDLGHSYSGALQLACEKEELLQVLDSIRSS